MADDTFALSPITARAAPPTEADYDAICAAFMETARGRWFLGEYARRNRNADTRLVLDVLARLEATVATQRRAPEQPPLAEHLPAVVEMIVEARRTVLAALPQGDLKQAIDPIQRAASLLREVAWTLRESGADGRVCDVLDVQASAIAEGCARALSERTSFLDVPAAVTAAFHSLTREINLLAKQAETPVAADQSGSEQVPPASEPAEPPINVDEHDGAPTANAASDEKTVVAIIDTGATSDTRHELEPTSPAQAPRPVDAPTPAQTAPKRSSESIEAPAEPVAAAGLWEDLEVIDAGPIEEEASASEPPKAEASPPEPLAAKANEAESTAVKAEHAERTISTSLGHALLESGVVPTPTTGRYANALAPIRRMSQAEKVAFFS